MKREEAQIKEVQTEELFEEETQETALAVRAIELPAKHIVDEALERARYLARKLVEIARESGMTFVLETKTGERTEGLRVDGWRLLASWCGFGIATEITSREFDESGKLTRVRAKATLLKGGVVFAYAEGVATRFDGLRGRIAENGVGRWAEATDDVLESVAQTNAVIEVCKQNLGFILKLAGVKVEEKPSTPAATTETGLTQQDWARFWIEARKLGFTREGLHSLYGVSSMKEVIQTKEDMEAVMEELKRMVSP